jgi:hypothetical protein
MHTKGGPGGGGKTLRLKKVDYKNAIKHKSRDPLGTVKAAEYDHFGTERN